MKVTLNKSEVITAMSIEMRNIHGFDKVEIPEEYNVTGNYAGAMLAVAKALDLYPKLDPGHLILVGRTHARMAIIHSDKARKLYEVPSIDVDVFVVVNGHISEYDFRGYVFANNTTIDEKGTKVIFDHVITPVTDKQVFLELIDDTRNWKDSYVREDGKWLPKQK